MKKIAIIILLFSFVVGCSRTSDDAERLYDSRDWDGILDMYSEEQDSIRIIDICRINVALASKGELADKAFSFPQYGVEGLIPEWHREAVEGKILTDVYYLAGHIALSRRMAFETDVCEVGKHQNEMIKRLVSCDLILGNWSVAEKYIVFLENQGGKYARWAESQRKFLRNDGAVESDPEYGPKRKCIPSVDFPSAMRGLDEDFKDIIRANPSHHNTIEILGLYYLLSCDFDGFKGMLDEFYGTEALMELPLSFQEAACFLSHIESGYWKKVGVSKKVHKDYADFLERMASGRSLEKYKNTYWVYVMRMNEQL